jgi:hypothetical protein
MPRVSRGAAVFIALVITTAGIGALTNLSLASPDATATIGSSTPVIATLTSGANQSVYLFAGTASGYTTVLVAGQKVTIPVAGYVFAAGSGAFQNPSLTISAPIPNDTALVGSRVTWVAVVVDNVTHRVVLVARTGGPIIEDAIC